MAGSLKVKSIKEGVSSTLRYIKARREGELSSLKTSFTKLNQALLNGIDWFRIFTIAGLSGGGKSTILEQIKQDILSLNKVDFVTLSFEFEMLIEDQLSRTISSKTNLPLKEMYSAFSYLDDTKYNEVLAAAEKLANEHSYYVDNTGTVEQVKQTIMEFVRDQNLTERGLGIIVTIDHVLLTKGKQGDSEKAIVDDLMTTLVELKKYYASIGQRCLFICLSQLNRDLEHIDRISTPALHYPNRNDIFASSAVYTCSDYVLITHKPAALVGLGAFYGPPKKSEGFPKGYPVKNPKDPSKDMIYWHLIKERFGKQKIMSMVENFEFSRIDEITLDKQT